MTLDPNDVFEAMLGDLSVTWTPGEFDATARWVYGKDGPMRRPGSGVPQNTRISAVVVVRTRVPSAEAESAADRVIESADVDEKIRPKLGWHAHDVIAESMSNEQMLCVSVHRNPFAKTPFPVEACAGPFDVQYDIVGVRAVREAFVGEALRTAREHGECVARMLLGADHAERRLAEMVLQVAGRAVAPKGDLSDQRPG
jgi:hypothetical protein